MGTRHLIAVQSDNEYKIAQYGQWDGYPSGQGVDVLEFLKSIDLAKLKESLKFLRFTTDDDQKELDFYLEGIGVKDGRMDMDQSKLCQKRYPLLSRDNGAEILKKVCDLSQEAFLHDSISFAGDSLFCEYAYIIDLDAMTFEIFQGFNKEPIKEGRFLSTESSGEYEPVTLVKTYKLDSLPSEDQFLSDLEPEDEDEEDAT